MISVAELLDWTKADASETALLRELEKAAVAAVQARLGFYVGVTNAAYVDEIRWRGFPLSLTAIPTGAITSLESWDGSAYAAVDADKYTLFGAYIFGNGYWETSTLSRFRATYPAGYTVDIADPNVWAAPDYAKTAVRLLVAHWFEHRESVNIGSITTEIPMGVEWLLAPHSRTVV